MPLGSQDRVLDMEGTVETKSGDEEKTLDQILRERQKITEEKAQCGIALNNSQGYETGVSNKTFVAAKSKAMTKSGPRELPSNRPVPVGRNACLGLAVETFGTARTVRRFDPRFEEHCGELRDVHVERNYSFVGAEREKRRKTLEDVVRRDGKNQVLVEDIMSAAGELERIRQDDLRRRAILRRREVLKRVVENEKEAVRRGKQPYFVKRRELRRLELRAQFDELKRQGGVKKFIQKRRRKLAGKDKKLMANKKD